MLSRGVGLDGKTEVLVAAVVLAVGHDPLDPSRIYRSLLDEHHPVFGHRLEALTTQEMLGVTFIGDSGRVEHTAMVNNVIRPFAQQALAIISRTPPWSPADFIKAGNAFKARYRDRAALWNRLTGQNI